MIEARRVIPGFLPLKEDGALACPPAFARRRALLLVRGSMEGGRGGMRRAGEAEPFSLPWESVRVIDCAP